MSLSPETFTAILADVAAGEPAHKALHAHGSNYRAFYGLLDRDRAACERYMRAKDAGIERLADEMQEIADNAESDMAATSKAKLQIETRKWLLSKLKPKKYGDHIDVAVSAVRTAGQLSEQELVAIALNRALPAPAND